MSTMWSALSTSDTTPAGFRPLRSRRRRSTRARENLQLGLWTANGRRGTLWSRRVGLPPFADATGVTMHPLRSIVRTILLGAGAAPGLLPTAHAQINDSIRGEPSEANHFIATPEGWEHPMTPWGEPDIRAKLDMMQASRVPLERCASSYRFGAPPCDMDKKWLTEEEYQAALEQWAGRVDVSRQALLDGDVALSLRTGLVDPNIPQRQTNLIVDPPNGLLPALTPEGKRRAPLMGSDWALPGETLTFDGPEDFDSWDRCITRGMPSSMMPYRYNG